jgi:hypothetical protein
MSITIFADGVRRLAQAWLDHAMKVKGKPMDQKPSTEEQEIARELEKEQPHSGRTGRTEAFPQKPSVGRIVHYVGDDYDGEMMTGKTRPAIIVHVNGDTNVNLQVFTDGSNDGASNTISKKSRVFSESPKPGHWSWPPRV